MRYLPPFLILIALLATGCTQPPAVGAFTSGTYRNLFTETWHSPSDVDAKVDAAFQQLFHGNPETQSIFFNDTPNASGPSAYICDIAHDDVRTEGMSYGMMICVQLNKKPEFDALWNWARTHMYHDDPRHPAYGFFSWSVGRDGIAKDEMPACDGEEYFATALYFADHRWGSHAGIYDYAAAADRILRDMRHRQPIDGPTILGPRSGRAMFLENPPMVRFVPSVDYTDPSYHLPAFYELWSLWGPPEDRAFWAQAAGTSRDFLMTAASNPHTSLAPDFANLNGTPHDKSDFHYDAWRVAQNVALDWSWFASDPREPQWCNRFQSFFWWKGSRYGNHFSLEGRELSTDHSSGLVAMNAVTALAATGWLRGDFVQGLWNLPIPTGKYRYYDGCLYMLALLECSGNYRIWPPRA